MDYKTFLGKYCNYQQILYWQWKIRKVNKQYNIFGEF